MTGRDDSQKRDCLPLKPFDVIAIIRSRAVGTNQHVAFSSIAPLSEAKIINEQVTRARVHRL